MPLSLIDRLNQIPLAVVDVETTGCSAEYGDRVIEVGLVRIECGRTAITYQRLIDPRRRIGPGITALTGITQGMVMGQPTFAEQVPQLLPLLEGAVIVGHNVRFDLSFLTREFAFAGIDLEQHLGRPPVLDTVRIARKMFGRGGNSLQTLAHRLGLKPSAAHRALADADTTARLLGVMLEPLGGWDLCLCDALKAQGGAMNMAPSRRDNLLPLELQEALDQRGIVNMEYVDARGLVTQRRIEPRDIRRNGDQFTLVAFCYLRNELRTFKVDRIVRLKRVEADPASGGQVGRADSDLASRGLAGRGLAGNESVNGNSERRDLEGGDSVRDVSREIAGDGVGPAKRRGAAGLPAGERFPREPMEIGPFDILLPDERPAEEPTAGPMRLSPVRRTTAPRKPRKKADPGTA